MWSEIGGQVSNDVEGKLPLIQGTPAGSLSALDGIHKHFNQWGLTVVFLKVNLGACNADSLHDGHAPLIVGIGQKERNEYLVAMLAVEVLREQGHKVGDDCQSMELELPQLAGLIPSNRRLAVCLGVKELEECAKEGGVNQSLLCKVISRIPGQIQYPRQQKLLQLYIFILSAQQSFLAASRARAGMRELILSGALDEELKEGGFYAVFVKEELVAVG